MGTNTLRTAVRWKFFDLLRTHVVMVVHRLEHKRKGEKIFLAVHVRLQAGGEGDTWRRMEPDGEQLHRSGSLTVAVARATSSSETGPAS